MTAKFHLLAGTAALLLAAQAATAQVITPPPAPPSATPTEEAQDTGLSDIVVTATRTGETRAQATPLAITVLSADKLTASNVVNVKDLVTLTPNLNVAQVTASAAIYIRGIGSNNVFGGSDPDVTVQSDGIYISRAFAQFQDYVDIDRIEVLRGPQGTLYGRNAVGGTINIISRLPTDELKARLQLTVGNFGHIQQQSYISGPLIPGKLQASLTSNYIRHKDYFDNIVPGANGTANANRGGVRGQIRFQPSDTVELITRADYNRGNEHVDTYSHTLAPLAYAPLATSLIGNYRKIAMDYSDQGKTRIWGISEEINVDLGDVFAVKSLTAYRYSFYDLQADQDDTDAAAGITFQREKAKQFSQELDLTARTDRFSGVAGLYYFRDHQITRLQSFNPPSPRTPAAASSNTVFGPNSYTRSWAGFAQGTYKITEALSATVGARYTEDRRIIDQNVQRTSLNPATLGVSLPGFPFIASQSRKYHAVTPKFALDYKITPTVLAYASATRGFKSGGTTFSATNVPSLSFGPETIWSYEGGIKGDFLDRRLRVNVSAFRYDYKDLQVQALLGVGIISIGNAASARVKGIEIETTARPVPALLLTANFSALDAKYRSFLNASVPGVLVPFVRGDSRFSAATNTFNASGNRLNAAPRYTFSGSAQYTVDVGEGQAFVRGEYYHQSRTYYDPSNAPITAQGAYGLINASVGWNSPDRTWSVQVVGKNLAQKEYLITIAANGATPSGLAGAPRTVVLQVSKSW